MKSMKKTKIIFGISLALILLLIIFTASFNSYKDKQNIISQVTEIAESKGLEDIVVTYNGKITEYKIPSVAIDSSNLETLSTSQMYNLASALSNASIYVTKFTCKNNEYEIFPSTRSIHKNGKEISNDYYNSESYQDAIKNDTSSNQQQTLVTNDDELGACWALAKDAVKSRLKSPTSAEFPFSYNSDGVYIAKSENIYTVKAWVEAENSFGSLIRNNFTVTMEKSGYGENTKFTLKSCTIE